MPGTGIIHNQDASVNDYALQPPARTRHTPSGAAYS
jgi:hypothetical protein